MTIDNPVCLAQHSVGSPSPGLIGGTYAATRGARLYGGIHFADDNTTAQQVGYLIGVQAWSKASAFFNGTAR
jgi:hypothetical protein